MQTSEKQWLCVASYGRVRVVEREQFACKGSLKRKHSRLECCLQFISCGHLALHYLRPVFQLMFMHEAVILLDRTRVNDRVPIYLHLLSAGLCSPYLGVFPQIMEINHQGILRLEIEK